MADPAAVLAALVAGLRRAGVQTAALGHPLMPPRGEAVVAAVGYTISPSAALPAVVVVVVAIQEVVGVLETPEAPERHLHSMLCRLVPGLLTR